MAEIRQQVKVFQVKMQCEKCNTGEMICETRIGIPIEHQHECNKCYAIKMFKKKYPCVEYEPLDGERHSQC